MSNGASTKSSATMTPARSNAAHRRPSREPRARRRRPRARRRMRLDPRPLWRVVDVITRQRSPVRDDDDEHDQRRREERQKASQSEVAIPQHLNADPRQHRERERDDGRRERRKDDELRNRQPADPVEHAEVVDLARRKTPSTRNSQACSRFVSVRPDTATSAEITTATPNQFLDGRTARVRLGRTGRSS